MARTENPKSNRQQAFKMLDGLTKKKREASIKVLKDKLKIGDSYAATLYAAHRTRAKNSGTMVKVYSIRDIRNGKPVAPYIKVENKFNPTPDDSLNLRTAKSAYRKALQNQLVSIRELELPTES